MTMSVASEAKRIGELLTKGRKALAASRFFEAERLMTEALALARHQQEFGRMAEILSPLADARRRRLQPALEAGAITIVNAPWPEERAIEPGCYLVQPPQVGADARRLRLAALSGNVPVAVVCREPRTQLGFWPIVVIGPSATLRTKIDPPEDPDHPPTEWFTGAMEALGDWAIESIDPEMDVEKRVDMLLARLDAVPDHEALHEVLAETCREAQEAVAEDERRQSKRAPEVEP